MALGDNRWAVAPSGAAPAELVLRCAQCDGRLESSTTTDGDGGLVELVSPCPRCRSRITVRQPTPMPVAKPRRAYYYPKSQQNEHGQYICIEPGCGVVLERGKRGPPPRYCTPHKIVTHHGGRR